MRFLHVRILSDVRLAYALIINADVCYYATLLLSVIYVECISGGSSADVFYIGWLRYFLGLNTILPSTDFFQWNNLCGFWCMPGFLFLYAVIPFLLCFVKNSRAAWGLVFVSLCLAFCIAECGNRWALDTEYENVKILARYSPFYQLQHFALGIMCFFACREGKIKRTLIWLLILTLIFMFVSVRLEILGSLAACVILLMFQNLKISATWTKWLRFISRYSFQVFLSHLLAYSIAVMCMERFFSAYVSGGWYHCSLFFLFCLFTVVIVVYLETVNRIIKRFM